MGGIFGYIGEGNNVDSLDFGLETLKKLKNRDYDSAGMAFWDNEQQKIVSYKAVGTVANLESRIDITHTVSANPIILHTRWATHGEVTEQNAHPHSDCKGNIWVVHNGSFENYKDLKMQLLADGHEFSSETDTEVIAHLIEKHFEGNLEEAVNQALIAVKGTYSLAVIARDDPGKIVAACLAMPLFIGVGDNEFFLASDPSGILSKTSKIINLNDNEITVITGNRFSLLREKKPVEIDRIADKGNYPHFVLKEIMEQPESLANVVQSRLLLEEGEAKLGGLNLVYDQLRKVDKAFVFGSGASYNACIYGEYILQEFAGLLTKSDTSSEFRYRDTPMDSNCVAIAVSRSGETADTLAAINEVKIRGGLTLGITNQIGSSQARETDAGVYTRTGSEVSVASVNTFTSQLTAMVLVALFIGRRRTLSLTNGQILAKGLVSLSDLAAQVVTSSDQIAMLAQKYKKFGNYICIGRKYSYPVALEGALKLKEISGVHAEGICGGEIKHGALALMCETFPTICIVPNDTVYSTMISNIQEVKARKSPVLAIATEGNQEVEEIADDVIYIPEVIEPLSPILSVLALQLFAYHTGVLRGIDVDRSGESS